MERQSECCQAKRIEPQPEADDEVGRYVSDIGRMSRSLGGHRGWMFVTMMGLGNLKERPRERGKLLQILN